MKLSFGLGFFPMIQKMHFLERDASSASPKTSLRVRGTKNYKNQHMIGLLHGILIYCSSSVVWLAAGHSGGAGGAREVSGSVRGGAVGVPEARNILGMFLERSETPENHPERPTMPKSEFGILNSKNANFFRTFDLLL